MAVAKEMAASAEVKLPNDIAERVEGESAGALAPEDHGEAVPMAEGQDPSHFGNGRHHVRQLLVLRPLIIVRHLEGLIDAIQFTQDLDG